MYVHIHSASLLSVNWRRNFLNCFRSAGNFYIYGTNFNAVSFDIIVTLHGCQERSLNFLSHEKNMEHSSNVNWKKKHLILLLKP